MKIKYFPLLILIICANSIFAQYKYEQEHRIKKEQFPTKAQEILDQHLENVKRLKFYKETDSVKISYEAKFKKDKLWYSMEFDASGNLEDIEIIIKPVDIPSDVLTNISTYFNKTYEKHRIKKIQQHYPTSETESSKQTIRNAFQNLLLPTIRYEIVVAGKKDNNYLEYEILFDAQGSFKNSTQRLAPNYDHVLY